MLGGELGVARARLGAVLGLGALRRSDLALRGLRRSRRGRGGASRGRRLDRRLRRRVAQADDPVQHGAARPRIDGVDDEVADPLELKAAAGRRRGHAGLGERALDHLQRAGIQVCARVAVLLGPRHEEEPIVEPRLDRDRAVERDPVDDAPDLDALGVLAADGLLEEPRGELDDLAGGVASRPRRT